MTNKPGPPPDRAQVWRTFAWQAVGIPLVVVAGIAIVVGALWLTGGDMFWQALSDMAGAVLWMGLIVLLYPVVLILWIADLRTGLHAADEWARLGPEAQTAALAAREATPPKRRSSRKAKS